MPLIDAYMHIGVPRFGSATDVARTMAQHRIDRAVLVLGPGVPDLPALIEARETLGDRVRLMGIPFGETEAQRDELCEVQLALGISGMRFMPFEFGPNPGVLRRLGEAGRWLYAINPWQSNETARAMLDWLEAHPHGRIASPHLMNRAHLAECIDDPVLLRELFAHERYFAILSRHGGASAEPFPHPDLRPWTEDVVDAIGFDKLMWGSEFPVLYWRDERIGDTREWIEALGIAMTDADRAAFFGGNARRLLFHEPAPAAEDATLPAWLGEQFTHAGDVMLMQKGPLEVPMADYRCLLSDYIVACEAEPDLTFGQYLAHQLGRRARELKE